MSVIMTMNPWQYVIKDELYIPGNKDQAFGRVLDTKFETMYIPDAPVGYRSSQVCIRIFCDTLDNLFMCANFINSKGELKGCACRIPIKMTSHKDHLKSGQVVNATTRNISEANIRKLKLPLINKLEKMQIQSLYNGRWWEGVN
jgi:hypothetical protein